MSAWTLNGSAFAAADWVEIRTVSGETLTSKKVVHAKGSHENPVSAAELETKFRDCTAAFLTADAQTETLALLFRLENLESASDLIAAMRLKR